MKKKYCRYKVNDISPKSASTLTDDVALAPPVSLGAVFWTMLSDVRRDGLHCYMQLLCHLQLKFGMNFVEFE